jgi:hypothetical protein
MNKRDFRLPFVVDVDPDAGIWRIDDPTRKPRTAFAFGDIVMDQPYVAGPNLRNLKTPFVASATLDHYPIDLDGDQRLLWLAYCATDYLRRNDGKPVIVPTGDARRDIETHACRIRTHWESESDLSPSTVDFIYDRDLMLRGVEELSYESGGTLAYREKRIQEIARCFTNGEITARFEVLSFTNVAGARIPNVWTLTCVAGGKIVKAYRADVTSVYTHERVQIPIVPAGAEIVDKRVRGKGKVNYVIYETPDGKVPSVDDPKVLTLVGKWNNPDAFHMPPRNRDLLGDRNPLGNLAKKRWFALGILVAVLTLLFLLVRMGMKKSE